MAISSDIRTKGSADYDRIVSIVQRRVARHPTPTFELQLPDGSSHKFGSEDEPTCCIRAVTAAGLEALLSFDELRVGEAYLSGDVDVPFGFLSCFELRPMFSDTHRLLSMWRYIRPRVFGQSRQNKELVPRHYEAAPEFYLTFLDERHHLYSQALYDQPSQSLEIASTNKLRYIIEATGIGPGTRVLDVGAGWGSLARCAYQAGASVTMLTVSPMQGAYLRASLKTADTNRLDVIVEDFYRFDPRESFDVVTFLGSMEHLPDYRRLMSRLDKLVAEDGFVYMDFSAIAKKYAISTFTYRYVFEGNGTPVFVPELLRSFNKSAFELLELHNDRHNYYLTVKEWAERLERNRIGLVTDHGEWWFRLFRLYLWATAYSLGKDASLEAYRLVARKCRGRESRFAHRQDRRLNTR